MKKLLTSIFVLITATAICHTYTELDANTTVDIFELKKEIKTADSFDTASKNT